MVVCSRSVASSTLRPVLVYFLGKIKVDSNKIMQYAFIAINLVVYVVAR